MKTLLFPTDFSTVAENALDYALNLASKINAELHLIHTYHYTTVDTSFLPPDLLRALEVEQEEEALRVIREYEERIQSQSGMTVPVTHKLAYGFAQEQILAYAKEIDCDLIVMGTTGASNLLGKMIGSVTSHILSRAECPVLAVPEKAKFEEIEQVAYASSFEDGETAIFERLEGFVNILGASLACVHIRTEEEDTNAPEAMAYDEYFKEKAKSHKLDYYLLNHEDIGDGLDHFVKINKTDILVMMTHKRSMLDKLFNPSLSRKMVLQSEVPLLVFQKETLFHLEEESDTLPQS